jgi:hypothetical protein
VRIRAWFKGTPGGRWVAVGGVLAGLALFAGELQAAEPVFGAAWKSCLTALAVMAVGGVAQSLWAGERVEEAEAGGVRLKFGATRRAIGDLNRRVTTQMDEVNKRLYDLEKAVFKDPAPDTGPEE